MHAYAWSGALAQVHKDSGSGHTLGIGCPDVGGHILQPRWHRDSHAQRQEPVIRWKPARNAFAVTFADRIPGPQNL